MPCAGLAGGPARRQRLAAPGAAHHAAQREIGADILPGCRLRLLRQTLLNALEGFEADKPLMFSLAKRNVPFGLADVTRVNRARQKQMNDLVGQARKAGMPFQEAAHLGARLKMTRCESFQCFLKD
jgi:hypothetical protein